MGIDIKQLAKYIIDPTLKEIDLYSAAATWAILGTASVESDMGMYLHQHEDGPALGIYQMEPSTHDDIKDNFLIYRPELCERIFNAIKVKDLSEMHAERMVYDLKYATIMCRLQYLRFKEPLPEIGDVTGMARYWKKYYNTSKGKGKVTKFLTNYELYIGS